MMLVVSYTISHAQITHDDPSVALTSWASGRGFRCRREARARGRLIAGSSLPISASWTSPARSRDHALCQCRREVPAGTYLLWRFRPRDVVNEDTDSTSLVHGHHAWMSASSWAHSYSSMENGWQLDSWVKSIYTLTCQIRPPICPPTRQGTSVDSDQSHLKFPISQPDTSITRPQIHTITCNLKLV